MDADGYGYRPEDRGMERLLADMRTLSPAGVARVAAGWDAYSESQRTGFHQAEKEALRALESSNRAEAWEDLRRSLFDLTEGRTAMVAWKAEHGDIGHKAEAAANGAALAVFAADLIDPKTYASLVHPMAEALPWLGSAKPA